MGRAEGGEEKQLGQRVKQHKSFSPASNRVTTVMFKHKSSMALGAGWQVD